MSYRDPLTLSARLLAALILAAGLSAPIAAAQPNGAAPAGYKAEVSK